MQIDRDIAIDGRQYRVEVTVEAFRDYGTPDQRCVESKTAYRQIWNKFLRTETDMLNRNN